MKIAVYAGSFDPLTNGHLWMVEQGARLFDELVVAIGQNPDKQYAYSLEDRLSVLQESLQNVSGVRVEIFNNKYLVDYAQSLNARYLLRGLRDGADYEFERGMRYVNEDLQSDISTVFLMPPREIAEISSSLVKGLIGPKGWQGVIERYVPLPVYRLLIETHQ